MPHHRKHLALAVVIARQKGLAVGHIGRRTALLMHIAFHCTERRVGDIAFHEDGTFIIEDVGCVLLRQLVEYLLSFLVQSHLGHTVAAVVMLAVDGAGTGQGHAGVVRSIGEQIGSGADADRSSSPVHKILDQSHIGLTQTEILTATPASGNHDSIQAVQNSCSDIAAVNYPHLHILIQTESRHRLADARRGTSVSLEHSHFYLLSLPAGGQQDDRHDYEQQSFHILPD